MKDDGADRIAQLIQFLAKNLATITAPDPSATFRFRSRMSLGNLLYDAHYQMKKQSGHHWIRALAASDAQEQIEEARAKSVAQIQRQLQPTPPPLPPLPPPSPTVNGLLAQSQNQVPVSSSPVAYDPDALMNTFEDFAFISDMSYGME
jgi:hypothetical protein